MQQAIARHTSLSQIKPPFRDPLFHSSNTHARGLLSSIISRARPWIPRTQKLSLASHALLLLLLLSCLLTTTASASSTLDRRKLGHPVRPRVPEALVIDRSVSSELPLALPLAARSRHSTNPGLHKRQNGRSTPPEADSGSRSNATMPQPFDSGIGAANLTASCTSFFNTFLGDSEVQACHPVSLLLMTSNGFFQATRSRKTVNEVLSASCSAALAGCRGSLSTYATQLKDDENCGADYRAQNPKVLQAYDGFISFEPTYKATCLKNPDSSNYCFADSVTNASSPTGSYYYYLPLGLALPAGTMPTCNKCLSETMKIYAPYAGNGSTPLSAVYGNAVDQTNVACGPTFVDAEVPAVTGAASSTGAPTWLTGLVVLVILWLCQ